MALGAPGRPARHPPESPLTALSAVSALNSLSGGASDGPTLPGIEILDPADLAGLLWDTHFKRDRTEEIAGDSGV